MSLPTSAPKPPASEAGAIAAAYDTLAAGYDAHLAPALWVRAQLWARLEAPLPAGARVLDVTAGTGLDAVHLAERGVRVVACDLSPAMLAQLHAKAPGIETHVADFNALPAGLADQPFDAVLSTFAGLNTAADLRPFARSAAHLLRPGGLLYIHLLNRWPLLDLVRHAARRHRRALWQGLTSDQLAVALGGRVVPHTLYAPYRLYQRVFRPAFRLERVAGQGVFRPVTGAARWGGAPRAWLERRLAPRWPFHALGTFFTLEMTRL